MCVLLMEKTIVNTLLSKLYDGPKQYKKNKSDFFPERRWTIYKRSVSCIARLDFPFALRILNFTFPCLLIE